MKKAAWLLFVFLFSIACNTEQDHLNQDIKIAFGSCSNQRLPQVMWPAIIENEPDLWIWMGDIIYMDSDSLEITREAYQYLKTYPDYKILADSTEVIGIWDDHDYGLNDGGKEWTVKDEKKELMFEFLDEPANSPRRKHKGVYISYDYYLKDDKSIKVILLDGRYFRDTLNYSSIEGRRYDVNPYGQGTLLGNQQWAWLEKELKHSKADLNIIVSGIQVLSEEHGFESWGGNFLHERDKLFDILKSTGVKNVLFLSGDRHIAEVSKTEIDGLVYPIYDVTSSGLTHSFEGADEPNKYRISPLIDQKNFGILLIKPDGDKINVAVELKGENDTLFYAKTLEYKINY
jgi:alkaline phosphatase D